MYRSQSPYGPPQPGSYTPASGYPQASPYTAQPTGYPQSGYIPYPQPPAAAGGMSPTETIFTRIPGPDGATLYQVFRTMPASFPSANGLVHGVQWLAAERVPTPPSGSKPADDKFVEAWSKGQIGQMPPGAWPGVPVAPSSNSGKSSKDDSKRSNNRHSRHISDYGDTLQATTRDRRNSFNASPESQQQPPTMTPFPGYPPMMPPVVPGYPTVPGQAPVGYTNYAAAYGGDPRAASAMGPYGTPQPPQGYGTTGSAHAAELARQMNDLNIKSRTESSSDKKKDKEKEKERESRSRRQSMHEPSRPPATDVYGYPTSSNFNERPQTGPWGQPIPAGYPNTSPYMGAGNGSYTAAGPPAGYPGSYSGSSHSSQGGGGRKSSNSSHQQDVWPPGHILEGKPKQPGYNTGPPPRSRSRAPSPDPMPGSYLEAQPRSTSRMSTRQGTSQRDSTHGSPNPQLAAPESFSRGINGLLPFSNFHPTLIHKMDDFFSHMPKMPSNLESHDVRPEDWFRFVEDLTLAWTGRLPAPRDASGNPRRPALIAAELIHTWNASFFEPRGIEIVLYKGRERRSGVLYGQKDLARDRKQGVDYSSSSTSEEESSDADDDSDDPYPRSKSRSGNRDPVDEVVAARKRYYRNKQEAKEERRERRKRIRERRLRRRYIIQALCIREGPPKIHPGHPGMPMGMTPSMSNNAALASAYPGMHGPGIGMPPPGKSSKRHHSGQY